MAPKAAAPFNLGDALVQAWDVNERMNQFLLEHLDERVWQAEPPPGHGRTIAAIFAHMHNVRHMWLVVSAKDKPAPPKVDRAKVTIKQAQAALAKSAIAMRDLLATGVVHPQGRIKDFPPGVAGFFGYAVSHEAHHRGQICSLTRQLGHRLPDDVSYGMWDWKARQKEI